MSLCAIDLVLMQARRLHLAAKAGSISSAMPVLRRIHAAGLFPDKPLGALFRQRATLKRKHFLRLLAVESGFPDWERFRPVLQHWSPEALDHFKVAEEGFAFLNCWFSTEEQALAYVEQHGGRVLRVGRQAIVMASDARLAS